MAGTAWGSADLLDRFNRLAGRPATDAIGNPAKYKRLADAQESVLLQLAGVAPRALYGAPTAMTSADGGYTWTFGVDGNGYPNVPLGNASIYPSLNAIPNYPWQVNQDYQDEGDQIRIPNNIAWQGPLYWYGITAPQQMSATVQPVLQPPTARMLIVIDAVRSFAEEAARNPALVAAMNVRWDREWPIVCTALRRHLRGGRTVRPLTSGGVGYGGYAGTYFN